MDFRTLNGQSITDAFKEFDELNPEIYRVFKEQCLKAIRNGRTKISSKAIINWMRWETFLTSTDVNFKINDAFTPHYARKFIKEFPEHEDIFEVRKLRTEESPPYMTKEGEYLLFQ